MTHLVAGNKAPEFRLNSLDGKEFSLSLLLAEGPVVVAFFKISCPTCQFTFPYLERLAQRYAGNGVTFVGISQDDARATAQFATKFGITFPLLLDEKNYAASNAYGLTTVPTILLIDPNDAVQVSSEGFVKKDLETIGGALAERKNMASAPLFNLRENVPATKPG